MVVHHEGKNTTGAGRGSNAFDAWLDTILWIRPLKFSTGGSPRLQLDITELTIQARDTDARELSIKFEYPTWASSPDQISKDVDKVSKAAASITKTLTGADGNQLDLTELRVKVLKANHSNYAFRQALKDLTSGTRIELRPDKTKGGNWKTVHLI